MDILLQAYVLVYQLSMEGVEERSAFIYTFASSEYYQPPALQHNGDWPRPFLNGQSNRNNPSMIVQNGNKNGKDSRFAQMKSPRHARKSYSNWSDDHMN